MGEPSAVTHGVHEPTHWFVIFCPTSDVWWVRWLACGRYKHVRACGYVAETRLWIFFDYRLSGMVLRAAPDSVAEPLIAKWMGDGDVIHIARGDASRSFFPMMTCVTAVRHLIGRRGGALRPDRLWRDLLAQGGKVFDGQQSRTDATGGRPAREAGQAAG